VSGSTPTLLTDGATSYIYDDNGLPVEQIDSSGNVLYYHHDQLGSTRVLTSSTGAVAATYTYDANGNLTNQTGTANTPLRWAGQYQDPTGLYYLRARYYDPTTSQFLTKDPLAASTGQTYVYSADNPANATDPGGLDVIGIELTPISIDNPPVDEHPIQGSDVVGLPTDMPTIDSPPVDTEPALNEDLATGGPGQSVFDSSPDEIVCGDTFPTADNGFGSAVGRLVSAAEQGAEPIPGVGGAAGDLSADELAQAIYEHIGAGDDPERPTLGEIEQALKTEPERIRDDALKFESGGVRVIVNESQPFRLTAYYPGG
jgi:RHS repeat-associated protein